MRTTIDIADDVLFAAKDYARRDKMSLGQVITQWGRQALQSAKSSVGTGTTPASTDHEAARIFKELGFKPFPSRDGRLVTNEDVNRLREELGI